MSPIEELNRNRALATEPISLEDLSRLGIDERNRLYWDGRPIQDSIDQIRAADPKDVQGVAVSQIQLLSSYHQIALTQSKRSFFWALIGSGVGLIFFVIAVTLSMKNGLTLEAIVPLLSGAVVNVVSGLLFYLYGKTTLQLNNFYGRLEMLQRYLLANSLCETLDDVGERDKARTTLIQEVFRPSSVPAQES
jgi:hypothetical protein